MLQYTDVVRWAIEEIPIIDKTFNTADGRTFGSFQSESLRQMYHFPKPEKKYNKEYLEKFAKENEIESAPNLSSCKLIFILQGNKGCFHLFDNILNFWSN